MVGTLGEKRATDILGKRMGLGHGMSYCVPGLLLSQKQTKKSHPTNGNEIPLSVYCT